MEVAQGRGLNTHSLSRHTYAAMSPYAHVLRHLVIRVRNNAVDLTKQKLLRLGCQLRLNHGMDDRRTLGLSSVHNALHDVEVDGFLSSP